jgi:hypothetical protein
LGSGTTLFWAGIACVIAFTAWMAVAVHIGDALSATLSFFGLILGVGALNLLWMPLILARRHALEAERTPLIARRARAQERRNAWASVVFGLLFGGLGLLVAFYFLEQL